MIFCDCSEKKALDRAEQSKMMVFQTDLKDFQKPFFQRENFEFFFNKKSVSEKINENAKISTIFK